MLEIQVSLSLQIVFKFWCDSLSSSPKRRNHSIQSSYFKNPIEANSNTHEINGASLRN